MPPSNRPRMPAPLSISPNRSATRARLFAISSGPPTDHPSAASVLTPPAPAPPSTPDPRCRARDARAAGELAGRRRAVEARIPLAIGGQIDDAGHAQAARRAFRAAAEHDLIARREPHPFGDVSRDRRRSGLGDQASE